MCYITISWGNNDSLKKLYSFYKEKKILWAYLEINTRCNFRCHYCYNEHRLAHDNFISEKDFNTLIEILSDAGIQQLTISGGEPTLHPNLYKFISIASKKGFIVHLCTNGYFIDEASAKILSGEGLSQVQINIDSHIESQHDCMRGKNNSFKKAISALNYFEKENISTVATTLINRLNYDEIVLILKYLWENTNFDRYRMIEYIPNKVKCRYNIPMEKFFKKIDEVIMYSAKTKKIKDVISYDPSYIPKIEESINIPCPIKENLAINIDYKGNVYFCLCALNKILLYNIFSVPDFQTKQKEILEKMNLPSEFCLARNTDIY